MTTPFDFFRTGDDLLIRYGSWPCGQHSQRGTIILLGGRREFMEKYSETIAELNQRQFDVYAMDWRGQGLSSRQLSNRHKGFVNSYNDYMDDLGRFVSQVIQPQAAKPFIFLAHSMGGHIALRFLHDSPGVVKKAVLVAPMIDIMTSFIPKWLLGISTRFFYAAGMAKAYVIGSGDYDADKHTFSSNQLTSDQERFLEEKQAIAKNPDLALGGVTYGWLHASLESIDILRDPDYAAGIRIPILIVSAGSDRVVSVQAQKNLCSRLPNCRMKIIPEAYHEVLKENDQIRSVFWESFDDFIDQQM